MRCRSLSLALVVTLIPMAPCLGQMDLYFDGTIPVHRDGMLLDLAWAGGINSAQVSQVDLNGDGLKDLFIFDRWGNSVITLLNTGIENFESYTVTREYDQVYPFQELHDWVLFRDYNGDGKEDIFSYSQAGFAVYRNISAGSTLAFELVNPQVKSNYVTTSGNPVIANLFVSQIDLPGIVDVDGDGDLDVLTFSLLGTYVEYHKNLSMELYGVPDSLKFEVRNRCWGAFAESINDNSVTLDAPCTFNVPNPEIGIDGDEFLRWEFTDQEKARAHSGSALCPLDLNGDALMDLLLGDVSYSNVVALQNGGTASLAYMTEEDTLFPSYDVSVDLPIFPASFYLDLNNDGKRDLVVSTNSTTLSENFRSMWYYRNIGTDASPLFSFQRSDLFQERMLEFGEGAFPVPFDHDGDGLMDLVVADHGYYQAGDTYVAKLALLRNVGTPTAPAFELVTDDYMGLSTSGIGLSMFPAFGDLDGDGALDMYIGDLQGRLHYYRNISAGPVAEFQLTTPNITDAGGSVIDVGQLATPIFHDLDEDGLLDLVIGERNGNLNYYRNTGTSSAPAWTLVSESLGGVSTVEWWNITGHSVPFLFQNATGEREILVGSEAGWLYHYGDIENNIEGPWTLLDSTFMGIRDGSRTAPCLYDFTGDGKLDLVVGNARGGLSFWRSDLVNSTGMNQRSERSSFGMTPNPASDAVVLSLGYPPPDGSRWLFRNALGQVLLSLPATDLRTTLSLTGLAKGLYLVQLEGPSTTSVQRLVIGH